MDSAAVQEELTLHSSTATTSPSSLVFTGSLHPNCDTTATLWSDLTPTGFPQKSRHLLPDPPPPHSGMFFTPAPFNPGPFTPPIMSFLSTTHSLWSTSTCSAVSGRCQWSPKPTGCFPKCEVLLYIHLPLNNVHYKVLSYIKSKWPQCEC